MDVLKNFILFAKEALLGFTRPLKSTGLFLALVAVISFISFIIVYPLWSLAVNFRPVFNVIAIAASALFVLYVTVKRFISLGTRGSLTFLLLAAAFVGIINIPAELAFLAIPLGLFHLLGCGYVKLRKILPPFPFWISVIFSYMGGFYWISLLYVSELLPLALLLTLFYVIFLGYLLYARKERTTYKEAP